MQQRIEPRLFLVGVAALAALSSSGAACTAPSGPQAQEPPALERRSLEGQDSCETKHVVAQLKGSAEACSRELQGQGGVWQGRLLVARPRRGDVYCGFTWKSDVKPDFSVFDPGKAPGEVIAAEVDCPVLRPSAPGPFTPVPQPLDPSVWQPLQKAFHEQVGLVKATDRRPTTSVAVIDTAVRKFWDSTHDNYGHGRLMGRVIADLACGDAKGCEGRLNNQLGLPHLTPSLVDTTYGGFFGTRGQLAEAISGAVDNWRLNAAVGAAVQHLILNLSVGWDPVKTADKKIPSLVTDDAVYLALARASCFGAVAIAAAGNSDGSNPGPVLPGGWETRPAPSAADCAEFGISSQPQPPPQPPRPPRLGPIGPIVPVVIGNIPVRATDTAPAAATVKAQTTLSTAAAAEVSRATLSAAAPKYRPLVYAAAGLDAKDRALETTRPKGRPRLAGYGWNVVTDDPVRAPGHTVILSGTSVAAAVVSGVAAAAWDAAPGLDGHTIMELVYRTAVTLPDDNGNPMVPDFCLGGVSCGAFEIRRVSACAVVQALQPGTVCQTVPAQGGNMPSVPENLYQVPTSPTEGELVVLAESEGDPPLPPGSDPPPPPGLEGPVAEDWVLPQPNWPRCAPCQIGNSGLLLGAFDPTSLAASGSVVTDIYVWAGAGYWQYVNPSAIYEYEGGFARLVGGGSYTSGYIVFNVTYFEFGVYVRNYQTPMQTLQWAAF